MPLTQIGATRPVNLPAPTDEQTLILDLFRSRQPVVVEALAGTGKTTTLRQIAYDTPRQGLYVAYNKAIVKEAEGRFPPSIRVSTAHALAYSAIGRHYAERLDGPRMTGVEIARRLKLQPVSLSTVTLTATTLARVAAATVRKFMSSANEYVSAIHLPARALQVAPFEELAAAVVPVAERYWKDLTRPTGRMPFTHDTYLKLWQLTNPQLPYDFILFDEAQDADPVVASVIRRQAGHAQVIYVGDRNQQLYAWRGAVDAMAVAPGTRAALTTSWRFGPEIAAEANRWLQLLGGYHRLTGMGRPGSIGSVVGPDAILCRTNGTALAHIMAAQQAGIPVAMAPGDRTAGHDIRRFAFAALDLMKARGTDHPELVMFSTWAELLAYAEDDDGGQDIKRLVGIVNRHGPAAVIDAVKGLAPRERAVLTVSTAHKAKGLEWDTVRVADDFTPPDEGEPVDPADLMLAYVTVTRAKTAIDTGSLNVGDWSR